MFCNVIWCLNRLCNLDTRISCLRELFPAVALRISQTSYGGPFVLTLQNSQATIISSLLQEIPACIFQSFPITYSLHNSCCDLFRAQITLHHYSSYVTSCEIKPLTLGCKACKTDLGVPLETLLPPFSSLLTSSHCFSDKPLISQVPEYPGLIPTSKPL